MDRRERSGRRWQWAGMQMPWHVLHCMRTLQMIIINIFILELSHDRWSMIARIISELSNDRRPMIARRPGDATACWHQCCGVLFTLRETRVLCEYHTAPVPNFDCTGIVSISCELPTFEFSSECQCSFSTQMYSYPHTSQQCWCRDHEPLCESWKKRRLECVAPGHYCQLPCTEGLYLHETLDLHWSGSQTIHYSALMTLCFPLVQQKSVFTHTNNRNTKYPPEYVVDRNYIVPQDYQENRRGLDRYICVYLWHHYQMYCR